MNDLTLIERSERFLTDVKKAKLLPQDAVERLSALVPEIKHVFETQTIWRTETEMRCSVLNDLSFPDKASKYHQAKLEQMVFFEQLLHLSFDFRKLQEDLSILEADIEELEDKLTNSDLKSYEIKRLTAELNKKNIEKEQMSYNVQHMQIQAKERTREVELWSKIKNELYDESFDKDNKDTNQLFSMTRRYIQEAFNAMIVGKNGDISSYNNIVGQFEMLVKECYIRGILDEALSYFSDPKIGLWVKQVCGIEIPDQPNVPDDKLTW